MEKIAITNFTKADYMPFKVSVLDFPCFDVLRMYRLQKYSANQFIDKLDSFIFSIKNKYVIQKLQVKHCTSKNTDIINYPKLKNNNNLY